MKYFIGEEYDIVYWKDDFKDFAGWFLYSE